MARQLLLVHHAALAPEFSGRYVGGGIDPPLGPRAAAQLKPLVEWLRPWKPERCLASPLLRARQTADVLAGPLGLRVGLDDDLAEVNLGQWEGRTFAEISAADPAGVARWVQLAPDFTFPGGEALAAFNARVAQAAFRLAQNSADVVLAIAHGGVIRTMICHYLGLEPRHYLLFKVHYAGCVVLELFGERGVLAGLNEPARNVE